MQTTVLITGGTGFIGSNLVRAYLEENTDVHLVIREESSLLNLSDLKDKLHIHYYDGNYNSLDLIMREVKPDYVFHLASLYITEHQPEEITDLINSNITFGTHLVEAMVRNEVTKLINTGTSWQHYNNEPYNPVNLYAATKEAFEKILKYYSEAHEFKFVTLKLFDTYGPDDTRRKIFYLLKQIGLMDNTLDMSLGEQLIDLVFINDVVNAFFIAAKHLEKGLLHGNSYAISSGNPIKLKELVDIYMEISGENLNINWGGRPYRKREVMQTWNKGEKLPRWEPTVSIQEGILTMISKN